MLSLPQFVVNDLHLIVELQERNFHLKPNEHIFVALMLYLDILRIIGFFFLLLYYLICTLIRCISSCCCSRN